MNDQVTLGADPEVFVVRESDNTIIPCVGILEGTKAQPAPLKVSKPETKRSAFDELSDASESSLAKASYMRMRKHPRYKSEVYKEKFFVQEDNVMAEFNIPVVNNVRDFTSAISLGLEGVRNALPKGYSITDVSAHEFTDEDLSSPQAQLIGCEPDFDAYAMGQMRMNPPDPGNMRTCGGHIHIGGKFNCPAWVAALFVEYAVCSYVDAWQKDFNSWYRRPGSFRVKDYGIEYRTPSNEWVSSNFNRQQVANAAYKTGTMMVSSSASELQTYFRLIDWSAFREILMSSDYSSFIQLRENASKKGFPI